MRDLRLEGALGQREQFPIGDIKTGVLEKWPNPKISRTSRTVYMDLVSPYANMGR